MKYSYNLAKSLFPKSFISRHWNIYPSDYKEILFNKEKLENFRSNELSYKFNDTLEKGIFSRTKKVFNRLSKITGDKFIENNKEVIVGNPSNIKFKNNFYDYHDLFLIYFYLTLLPFLYEKHKKNNPFVSEIGGGYGGLMYRIKKNFPNAVCMLFDLPEQNFVSNYYLTKLNPNAKVLNLEKLLKIKQVTDIESLYIVKEDLRGFDYIILPGYLIEKLDQDLIDIFINTRSFMEMNLDTVNFYFKHIHRAIKHDGLFYCVNRYQKKTSGDLVKFKSLPFDKKWKFKISRKSFCQPLIHEALLRRVASENALLKKELSRLRPYDIEFFQTLI